MKNSTNYFVDIDNVVFFDAEKMNLFSTFSFTPKRCCAACGAVKLN